MTRLTRRQAIGLTASSAVAALAGCLSTTPFGNESETAGDGTLGSPAERVDVEIRSTPRPGFEPRIVHVEPGGTVAWSVDGHRHDSTAYHPDNDRPQRIPDDAEPWASGIMSGNSTFERTFDVEGVYDYTDTRALCTSHETLGAVGRVVVGWPDLESEPAIRHDADGLPGRARIVMHEICEETVAVLG